MQYQQESSGTPRLVVCMGLNCWRRGAGGLVRSAKRRVGVAVVRTHCLKLCPRGPVAVIYPWGVWYGPLTRDTWEALLASRPDRELDARMMFRMADRPFREKISENALPERPSDLD